MDASAAVGRAAEYRVKTILRNSSVLNSLGEFKIVLSNPNDALDQAGIDILVETAVGNLCLNVKQKRQKPVKEYRDRNIFVVYASHKHSYAMVVSRLYDIVDEFRMKLAKVPNASPVIREVANPKGFVYSL